jgi:hypothetical protein
VGTKREESERGRSVGRQMEEKEDGEIDRNGGGDR